MQFQNVKRGTRHTKNSQMSAPDKGRSKWVVQELCQPPAMARLARTLRFRAWQHRHAADFAHELGEILLIS